MSKFEIYINGASVTKVDGTDVAGYIFEQTKEYCENVGLACDLIDGETGEVLQHYDPEEAEEECEEKLEENEEEDEEDGEMIHYLFAIDDEESDDDGFEFLVGAYNMAEASKIIEEYFGDTKVNFIDILSDDEAEMTGLDEY